MLSSVLKSEVAIQANRKIMKAENPEEEKPRRPIGFIQPDNDEV